MSNNFLFPSKVVPGQFVFCVDTGALDRARIAFTEIGNNAASTVTKYFDFINGFTYGCLSSAHTVSGGINYGLAMFAEITNGRILVFKATNPLLEVTLTTGT